MPPLLSRACNYGFTPQSLTRLQKTWHQVCPNVPSLAQFDGSWIAVAMTTELAKAWEQNETIRLAGRKQAAAACLQFY